MRSTILVFLSIFVGAYAAPSSDEHHDYTLHLGNQSFDPLVRTPTFAGDWGQPQIAEPDFHLVQFSGPIKKDWYRRLEGQGLKVIQYIHPFTYIVWGSQRQITSLDHSAVRWQGAFLPAYRVLSQFRIQTGAPKPWRLLAYREVSEDVMTFRLQSVGATNLKSAVVDGRFRVHTFVLAPDQLLSVASIPGVYTVQEQPEGASDRGEMACQFIANQVVDGNIVSGYTAWLATQGLDGTGVTVANVDSGIENDHPDLAGAFLPCTGQSCDENGDETSSHGTHTAGIVAGRATSGTVDAQGFLRVQGMAPGAMMIEQVYGNTILLPGGMLLLMSVSHRNGAHFSSNSWGPNGTAQGYDIDTMLVDTGVRDADPQEAGNQAFSYVLAIDNGLGGTSSQGTPDEGKNIFRVGSSWLRNTNGVQRSDIYSVSDNSAHGPSLDGRFLPDIIAPGKWVDSASLGASYQLRGGTSMAAPGVSGAAALFYQLYRTLPHNPGGFDPSPAMVRAAMMAPARDLEGGTDADGQPLGHRFDNQQGWGQLNLEAVLEPVEPVAYMDAPVVFTGTGDTWSEDLFVANNDLPVYIMMVYTDAPGHGLGGNTPALNNNLNLEIDYGGQTYLGNQIGPDGWSVIGGSADALNNIEGVLLGPTTPTSDLTIRINAANINSDAIPGNSEATDQDFAVVCYNCVQAADYLLAVDESQKVTCGGTDASFTINVGQLGGFTEPVTLSAVGLPPEASISFDTNPLVPPAATVLTIGNTDLLGTGDLEFTLQATGGSIDHTLDLVLRVEQDVPIMPTLSAPLDGADGQSKTPLFRWQAIPGANNYDIQVATDMAFTDVVITHTQTGTEFDTLTELVYLQTYYWRVRADNPCGVGAYSAPFSFQVQEGPPILLVDDDDNLPNYREIYTSALGFHGATYDLWDVSIEQADPPVSLLSQYQAVIWFSGNAFNEVSTGPPLAGPDEDGEAALSTYLDGGGKLYLSALHYLLDRGGNPFVATPFMTDYLGLDSASLNVAHETVQGEGIFSALGPWGLSYPWPLRTDVVTPDVTAETVFSYVTDDSGAGLMKDTGTYRAIFTPWPFEALSEGARVLFMAALIDALGITVGPCANEDDFDAKLPFWPDEEGVDSLTSCINSFLTR